MKLVLVTPVYNRKEYFQQTIDSVLSQIHANQYVIIDGGSNDGTEAILGNYRNLLQWFCSEPDNGMYDAINKGFLHTDAPIMGWINSDDILLPGAIERILNIFNNNPDVEWITGLATVIDSKGMVFRSRRQRRFTKESFLVGDIRGIQQESTFWRRSLWQRVGGQLDINYKFAADYELWCRFFQCANLNFVDLPLGAFRRHGNQITQHSKVSYREEVVQIRKKYRKKLSCKQLLRGYVLYLWENLSEKYFRQNTIKYP